MEYIDAEKLIAEIKRRLREIPKKEEDKRFRAVYGGVEFELMGILDFIDSLPEDKPSEELEKEITSFIESHYHIRDDETLENGNSPLTTYDLENIARHFYELGLKARK